MLNARVKRTVFHSRIKAGLVQIHHAMDTGGKNKYYHFGMGFFLDFTISKYEIPVHAHSSGMGSPFSGGIRPPAPRRQCWTMVRLCRTSSLYNRQPTNVTYKQTGLTVSKLMNCKSNSFKTKITHTLDFLPHLLMSCSPCANLLRCWSSGWRMMSSK